MSTTPDLSRRNFFLRSVSVPVEPEVSPWDEYFGSYEMAYAQVN